MKAKRFFTKDGRIRGPITPRSVNKLIFTKVLPKPKVSRVSMIDPEKVTKLEHRRIVRETLEEGRSTHAKWLDEAYLRYLRKTGQPKTYESFRNFFLEAQSLEGSEELNLLSSGTEVRIPLAKERGTLELNKEMERWYNRMHSAGDLQDRRHVWLYETI